MRRVRRATLFCILAVLLRGWWRERLIGYRPPPGLGFTGR